MNEYSALSKENLIDMTIEKDRIIKNSRKKTRIFLFFWRWVMPVRSLKKSEIIDQEEVNLFNYNEAESLAITTLEAEVKQINHRPPRKAKAKNHSKIDLEKFVTKTVTYSPIKDDEDASDYDRISQHTIYKANVNVKIEVTKHIYETVKRKDKNQLLTDQRDFPFNNLGRNSFSRFLCLEREVCHGCSVIQTGSRISTRGIPAISRGSFELPHEGCGDALPVLSLLEASSYP